MIPPKNKEVLHVLDIIRRQLQFEGENMDTFLRPERKMQDSIQIKLNKKQLHSISLETNNIQLSPLFVSFIYFLRKNKGIALRLL